MDNKTIALMKTAVRRRQPMRKITNALRLVNGLGDGLPGLVIEQYNRNYVIHLFKKRWTDQKAGLAEFMKTHLHARYLIIKERLDSKVLEAGKINASVWIEQVPSTTVVQENGLNFSVDLNDGLNSGLFLDMRRNRQIVAKCAKGVNTLNCFAYTCSFGVYARAAGASSVINVDISQKSLERGRENYRLNNLNATNSEFIRENAITFMKRALKKGKRFGCVIIDPPSFARHEGKIFNVKKDLALLVALAMDILEPRGVLLIATNFSGLSHKALEKIAVTDNKEKIKIVTRLGQDTDFRGSGRTPESHLVAILIKTR